MPPEGHAGPKAPATAPVLDDATRAAAAAAAVVGVDNPLVASALLLRGKDTSIWVGISARPQAQTASSEKAPVIDRDLLTGIVDRAPMQNREENHFEAFAYSYLLIQAHKTSLQAFARSARRDLTFAHLWEEPAKYRGQVVHIEGRLRRLRRFDAPRQAADEGVPTIYEGWIFGDVYNSNPYCVIVTEIPSSIPVREKIDDRWVAFDGYFFKRYRYQAGDSLREAPLLIGRSMTLRSAPAEAEESPWSVSNLLGPAILASILATVLLVIGLSLWFRRGDRQFRSQLRKTSDARFVEPNSPSSE
jgi:hypothetical protein